MTVDGEKKSKQCEGPRIIGWASPLSDCFHQMLPALHHSSREAWLREFKWRTSNEHATKLNQETLSQLCYLHTKPLYVYVCIRIDIIRCVCIVYLKAKPEPNGERNGRLTRPHSQRLSESQTLHEHQLRQSRGAGPSIRATPPFPTPCNTNSRTDNNHCKIMKYYVAHCKVVSCHTTTYSKEA